MAPRPGGNSSSTRASTPRPAGCTRRAASTMSTSSRRRSKRAAASGSYRYGQVWRRLGHAAGHDPLPDGRRADGRNALHDLANPSRPDRPHRRRQVDRLRDDGPAGPGAAAELPADQGDGSWHLPRRCAAAGQQLATTPCSPTARGRDRLSPPAVRAAAQRPFRLYQAGRRQRSARPIGARSMRLANCPT